MGDVTSGMASTVIQVYLRSVLDSYLNENVFVRHAVVKIISLILAQVNSIYFLSARVKILYSLVAI